MKGDQIDPLPGEKTTPKKPIFIKVKSILSGFKNRKYKKSKRIANPLSPQITSSALIRKLLLTAFLLLLGKTWEIFVL